MLVNIISQSSFTIPPLDEIPDESDDLPKPGRSLVSGSSLIVSKWLSIDILPQSKIGPLELPAIIFGAAAFSNQYNNNAVLNSTVPVRTVRLALRYARPFWNMSPLLEMICCRQVWYPRFRHIHILWAFWTSLGDRLESLRGWIPSFFLSIGKPQSMG